MKIKFLKNKVALILILLISIVACKSEDCKYDGYPYGCNNGMDVAFLIDYTGSMGGAIENIKSNVGAVVGSIITQSGGDYRLSLSIFDEQRKAVNASYESQTDYIALPAAQKIINTTGATTNQYLTSMEKFGTANTTTFTTQLGLLNGAMSLGNGFGSPEPGGLLLNEVLNNSAFAGTWRGGTVARLAIIITDNVAGGDDDTANATDDAYLASLATTATSMGIQLILVTTMPGTNYKLQLINNNTSGVTFESADFSNLSNDLIQIIEDLCLDNTAS